jgi:inner membrane protein involved in colicin E2 resistance
MPVGLSPFSISRVVAGILAALWAMAGLANNYVMLAAAGPSSDVIFAIVANVLLTTGASLAFVNARGWRTVLGIALILVTLDRIVTSVVAGASYQQLIGAVVAFIAIGAVTSLGYRSARMGQ